MSKLSNQTASLAAFVEEYDEDADAALTSTRRSANVSARPDSRAQSIEPSIDRDRISVSSISDRSSPGYGNHEETADQINERSSPPSDINSTGIPVTEPPDTWWSWSNSPSEPSHFLQNFTQFTRRDSLSPSSSNRATVASGDNYDSDLLSPDESLRARDRASKPPRKRHRPLRSRSKHRRRYPSTHITDPVYNTHNHYPPYHTTPYSHHPHYTAPSNYPYQSSALYSHPSYYTAPYNYAPHHLAHYSYPSHNPALYAAQNPRPPVHSFASGHQPWYSYHHPGTQHPTNRVEVPTPDGEPSHPNTQTSEAPKLPPQPKRRSAKPVHHFINLCGSQFDRQGDDLKDKPMPWRAFTREFPLEIPGKPQMRLERYGIVQSQLISRAAFRQDNAAILTYDREECKERRYETRWLHYTSDTLELRSFMTEILQLKEVPVNAFPLLTDLFRHLEDVYEKPFVHGKYLEPTVRRFVAGDTDQDADCNVEIVFIGFPYLSLEALRSQPNADRESVHPVRSLLQFHYSFVSTISRDKQQVSRRARNQRDMLYVPQVWLLLINNDLIISAGPLDTTTLGGNYVHFEKAGSPTSAPEQRQVRLVGIQGKQYCIPLDQCQTWFGFIKAVLGVLDSDSPVAVLFLNDSWRNTIELLVGSESVSEVNWLDIIRRTSHLDITVRLVERTSVPKRQDPPLPMTEKLSPSSETQLVISPKAHAGLNGAYHTAFPSAWPNQPLSYHIYQPYNMSPLTPYYHAPWLPNAPMGIPGYPPIETQALVRRSPHAESTAKKGSHHNGVQLVKSDECNSKQSAQPIRLTDLLGAQLQIPWRRGRSWTNMYPVIAIKMHFTAEHRHAFNTDNYVLDAPAGPITSKDWDEKVYPGISVTLRLNSRPTIKELQDTPPQLTEKGPPCIDSKEIEEDVLSLNDDIETKLERVIDNGDTGVLSEIDEQPDGSISLFEQPPDDDTTGSNREVNAFDHLSCEFSEQPSGHDANSSDREINVFDYLSCENDDEDYFARDLSLGMMNPFRYQVRNDAWKTKETLVKNPSVIPDSPSSCSGTLDSFNMGHEQDDKEYFSGQRSLNVMNPFRYHVPKDAWKTKEALVENLPMPASPLSSSRSARFNSSSDSLSSSTPPTSATGEDMSAFNTSRIRPLFAWKIDTSISPRQSGNSLDGKPYEKERPDDESASGVAKLLEKCDKEAFYLLTSHAAERMVMNKVPKSSIIQVQVEMERTRVSLLQLGDDSDSRAPERDTWERKEKIIMAALHLLDCFVPAHSQKLDESWLIGKFFGAIYAIVHGSYADSYLNYIQSILSYLVKLVDRIHAGVAHDTKERSAAPVLPSSLVHALPPLIFLVCISSQIHEEHHQDTQRLQIWTEKCYDWLTNGKCELINMARTGECSKVKVFTSVDAEDMVALVIRRLVELPRAKVAWQQKSKDGFNLLEMYRNHISQMEFRARQSPSSDLFDEIQQLMEEIQILYSVLDQQLSILELTLKVLSCSDGVSSNSKLSSSCITQSQQHLKQTRHDLSQLENMADRAAIALRYMLEVRKESNSKAITIFTVVTVIFLPLSFVTSYLGMNSVDIRDGTFTQAMFWAIAVPVAACLVGVLWVALRFRRRIRQFVLWGLESIRMGVGTLL